MNWTRSRRWRIAVTAMMLLMVTAGLRAGVVSAEVKESTPTATWSCDMATAVASPASGDGMSGMDMGTPTSDMEMGEVELDQLYIDMMIPHHASIVALSQAALPRLTDERLIEIARTIIDTQTAEQEELRRYREEFYGDPEPMAMEGQTMDMMMEAMSGMGSMEDMSFQMDSQAQVNAFCAAENPDLAFIDLTIPHHEMAIAASEIALEQAIHQEIKDFSQRVIDAQQAEIDELLEIRKDLAG